MNKCRSLETLLQTLDKPIETGQLAIAQTWREDECAIGFYKPDEPRLSAYVFTHGQEQGDFGVNLEFPDPDDLTHGRVTTMVEALRQNAVLNLLATHFDLYWDAR